MKSFAIMVLGCKVNDYEATFLRNKMLKEYKEVSFKDEADIYIIFTCCVTNMAEAKTRKMLHKAKANNPNAFVVAIGCLSQIKGDSEDFKDVDLIIGSTKKKDAYELINAHFKGNVVEKLDNAKFENLYLENYPKKSRSFLKVQDGCNQFCAYCIIPYARGRERSAKYEDLINQAKILSKTNKELVLTGIHTGRYNDGKHNLYDLLKGLIEIDDLKTIRLSSIELNEISDEIIELMKNSTKLAHHLHIPVQSCSNDILKAMNRPYTIEEFINRIEFIRKEIPDISISTDLIVGFPGESDELFKETINNIKKIKFSFIHVFPYARKKGTVADKLEGHLDSKIKKDRVNKIIEINKELIPYFEKQFINKELELLIEKKDDIYVYGYVKQYFYVKAKGFGEVGNIVSVKILEVNNNEVLGSVIK